MKSKEKEIVFWDSCVFLAWLKEEQDKDLDAIKHLLERAKKGELIIGVSPVSRVEVLFKLRGDRDKIEQWRGALDQDYIHEKTIDQHVATRAAEMRIALRDPNNQDKSKLPLADALILASAEIMESQALHTYDKSHLLPLDGDHNVTRVRIIEPPPIAQPGLPMNPPSP